MSAVFGRAPEPLMAVSATGCWITDALGRRYLDASGGAVVTGIGHGRKEVIEALTAQLEQLDYVHASAFTSRITEEYCRSLAEIVPVADARIYPVSGGSEATETVLKMARTYQATKGRPERSVVVGLEASYHGNTLGALDLSGRPQLRAPYESWLGRFRHLPLDIGRLEEELNRGDVAAFVAEPISGASRAAEVPPDDYWPAVAELCRRHEVLLVVDEVMTGFGRTGRWFGIEHWDVEPDLMICGKGASSGYWPLGLAIASGRIYEAIGESFVHGFTYSHHPAGAAVGKAVLDIIKGEGLVEAAARKGALLRSGLEDSLGDRVIDIRGKGLLIGIELDADPRAVVSAARAQGLLVYPAAIPAILLGPPLVITDAEIDQLVDRLAAALAPP
ncbi:MAG TPA: aminotransferase class III-fold pyridoxal phosphate-dependent enzyme [Acidimicrobiia bacterium]|nr:aminotransferase class III-fold pyridoxal phosphate-dependent enzyme [Acidimicrobiia bacterium]